MYGVLVGLRIASTFNDIKHRTVSYIFFLISIVFCLVALVMIRQEWVIRRDRTIFGLTVVLNALLITQIQINFETFDTNEYHTVVASLIAFSVFNRRNYSFFTTFIVAGTSVWYAVAQWQMTAEGRWMRIKR